MAIKTILLSALIAIACFASAWAVNVKEKGELRHFSYPVDYVTGRMELRSKNNPDFAVKDFGPVRGSFDVFVPADKLLAIELNVHLLSSRDKLQKFSTAGIDRFKASCMSLEDEDESICSNALKELPKFEHPIQVDCDRSDLRDEGISQFKSLEKVTLLSCFCAGVHGAFLKDYKRLQSLETMTLFVNPVITENLQYLKYLRRLVNLNLAQTNATDRSLKYVSECSGLNNLDLSKNDQITDQGLRTLFKCDKLTRLELNSCSRLTDKAVVSLLKLPRLHTLGLVGTNISASGLEPLAALHLKYLKLPHRYYKVEMSRLEKLFVGTQLISSSQGVSADTIQQWGPLK